MDTDTLHIMPGASQAVVQFKPSAHIPNEILLSIVKSVPGTDKATLLNLLRCSMVLNVYATPVFYSHISLPNNFEGCEHVVRRLEKPELNRHIRYLSISADSMIPIRYWSNLQRRRILMNESRAGGVVEDDHLVAEILRETEGVFKDWCLVWKICLFPLLKACASRLEELSIDLRGKRTDQLIFDICAAMGFNVEDPHIPLNWFLCKPTETFVGLFSQDDISLPTLRRLSLTNVQRWLGSGLLHQLLCKSPILSSISYALPADAGAQLPAIAFAIPLLDRESEASFEQLVDAQLKELHLSVVHTHEQARKDYRTFISILDAQPHSNLNILKVDNMRVIGISALCSFFRSTPNLESLIFSSVSLCADHPGLEDAPDCRWEGVFKAIWKLPKLADVVIENLEYCYSPRVADPWCERKVPDGEEGVRPATICTFIKEDVVALRNLQLLGKKPALSWMVCLCGNEIPKLVPVDEAIDSLVTLRKRKVMRKLLRPAKPRRRK